MNDSELINLVEQYKQLYDKRNPEFKNKIARENAWTTISCILGDTAANVESRWNILRNRYAKERRKVQQIPTGSAGTGSEVSYWHLFKEMGFLDKFIVPRRTQGNIIKNDLPITPTSLNSWDTFSQLTQEDDTQVDEMETAGDENTPEITVSLENEEAAQIHDSQILKRKRHESILEKTSQLRRKARNTNNNKFEFQNTIATAMTEYSTFSNKEEGKTNNDEDLLFGKSLGCSLSQIKSKKEKALCKIKLLEVIQEFMDD